MLPALLCETIYAAVLARLSIKMYTCSNSEILPSSLVVHDAKNIKTLGYKLGFSS